MIKINLNDVPEYYHVYIKKVIDKDILSYLTKQKELCSNFFNKIDEEKSLYRYENDKWSIKQILGHITDTERIFSIRALHFARKDKQPLIGYEQDDYVAAANFDSIPFNQLVDDFIKTRESSISLFNTFDGEAFSLKGIANGVTFSVAALIYIIAGHVDHHVKVINERYR